MTRARTRAIVVGALAIALGAVACGGGQRDGTSGSGTSGSGTSESKTSGSGTSGSGTSGSGTAGSGTSGSGTSGSGTSGSGTAGSGTSGPPAGQARVRVEWPDVPAAARRSPGVTPCGTARAPSVAPTTTWGVPEALVILDGEPATGAEVRVELAACALAPRALVGASLAVVSATESPAQVALVRRGALADLDHPLASAPSPRALALPIAGHRVVAALEPLALYAVATTDAATADAAELAWVATARGAITDASGVALLTGLSPGSHAFTAYLPPRAGQPPRVAHGRAIVAVNDVVDVVVTLQPVATP